MSREDRDLREQQVRVAGRVRRPGAGGDRPDAGLPRLAAPSQQMTRASATCRRT